MGYINRVDLSKQAKLFSGNTAIFEGSINLGENLIVSGDVKFTGVPSYTGDTYTVLILDDSNNVSYRDVKIGAEAVTYKGTYDAINDIITSDDVDINGIPLPSGSTDNNGWYFIITSGNTVGDFEYKNGDYIISQGLPNWGKINNSDSFGNVVADNGIEATVSGDTLFLETIFDTALDNSLGSVAVGGVSANTPVSSFTGKTLVNILESILFPDQAPTYTIPTIGISVTSGSVGTKEVGSPLSLNFSVSGTKNDTGAYTALRLYKNSTSGLTVSASGITSASSLPSQYGYTDPNNPNFTYTVTGSDSFNVPLGNTTYKGQGDYTIGLVKKNNKGVDDTRTAQVRSTNAPQAASTNFDSSTQTVTGIYPYFYGKSSSTPTASSVAALIAAGSGNKQLADSNGNINITFGASGEFLWFAIPNISTSKTKWFVDALNSGNIGGGTNLFGTEIPQSCTSESGYWTLNYKIYISNYATSTTGNMQMQN